MRESKPRNICHKTGCTKKIEVEFRTKMKHTKATEEITFKGCSQHALAAWQRVFIPQTENFFSRKDQGL